LKSGHRFSCERLLAKADCKKNARKKMFDAIQKRFDIATKLDQTNDHVKLNAMEETLLGDADALLTNPQNEFIIFRIYDMLARLHQCNKNMYEFHRLNMMKKYIVDRMDDSPRNNVFKTTAYISVGQSCLIMGKVAQSIVIHTKCTDFCKEYLNEQRHLWLKCAHGYFELGEYQECINQIKYAITIPVSTFDMITQNLPTKHVETASQLLLFAQCHLALRNYNRALIFHKLLWHYSTVKDLKDFIYSGKNGIATVIFARAKYNYTQQRQTSTLLAPQESLSDAPQQIAETQDSMSSFSHSLQKARIWYLKDSLENGGLYVSTFLRLAFLYHDIAQSKGMGMQDNIFQKLTVEEGKVEKIALSEMTHDALTHDALTDKVYNLAETMAVHMESEHNKYLMKYLKQQVRTGRTMCCFCEQSRHENDTILMCSGCGVVRFCNKEHQKLAAKSASAYSGRYVVTHKKICKLLNAFVQYCYDKSLENTHSYLKEQRVFFARGMMP